MKKKDDFLKSPAKAPAHRKVIGRQRHFPTDTKSIREAMQTLRCNHIQKQW